MPKYREVYLEKDKTLADSGTETIEIATADPISEIELKFYAVNGATSNKGNPIARVVTKIEVFDGSDKLFSMDGRLATALYCYQSHGGYRETQNEAPLYTKGIRIPLRFGRWLWDPLYALIPQSFRNLQLKVSWNLAEVRAVGATGFGTGTAKMSVIVKVMEGLEAPPVGFFMSKDHYAFTSAGSGEERIALPTDHPYVSVLMRAWETGIDVSESITNLKLSLDHDKDIPFDIAASDAVAQLLEKYGEFNFSIFAFGDDAEAHEVWFGSASAALATAQSAGIICAATALSGGKVTMSQLTHAGVAQNGLTFFLLVAGQALYHAIYREFGDVEDPTTWLNAPDHGDIKLILTQGNAGAETNVVLTQARAYAVAA